MYHNRVLNYQYSRSNRVDAELMDYVLLPKRLLGRMLTRVWNDLPYAEFDTGTLDGFKGVVNRWLLP